MRALHDHMTPVDIANNEEADLALREAEACSRLQGLLGAALLASDTDDEDYTLQDDTAGSSSKPPTEPNTTQAQFELMQSLQAELIHMRKSQEDRFDAMMRKSQKHDEALASLFLGQQTLLQQMRDDRAHNNYQFAYIFQQTSMLPPAPMPPNTQPSSHFPRRMLCMIIRKNPHVTCIFKHRCTMRLLLATKKLRRRVKQHILRGVQFR